MVNLYVGITDYDWFRFLSALPGIDEVNFWQPGGRTNFQAPRPGELFLFKLHAPRNFIVGGGVFARADILPTSLAWEAFGASNGAPSLAEMRRRIVFYRGVPDDARQDYSIGCRVLTQPFLLPENQWIPIPPSWSRHIQQGRTYDAAEGDGRLLWEAVMDRSTLNREPAIESPRYGSPILIQPDYGRAGARRPANACAASRSSPRSRTNCAPRCITGCRRSSRPRRGRNGSASNRPTRRG